MIADEFNKFWARVILSRQITSDFQVQSIDYSNKTMWIKNAYELSLVLKKDIEKTKSGNYTRIRFNVGDFEIFDYLTEEEAKELGE